MANAVSSAMLGFALVAMALVRSTRGALPDVASDEQTCGGDRFEGTNLIASDVNDPSQSIVDSSGACCELCAAEGSACRAWTWHQPSGQCALKASLGEKLALDGFESGEIPTKNDTREESDGTTASIDQVFVDLNEGASCDGCSPASGKVDFTSDCNGKWDKKLTRTNHKLGKKSSALECCEACLNSSGCFGWTWQNSRENPEAQFNCWLAFRSPGSMKSASGYASGFVGSGLS